MSDRRSVVLIAVESMEYVEEERLMILNMLSVFVPNAYRQQPRPAFVFKPHQFDGQRHGYNVGRAITDCIARAKHIREANSADICLYSAIAGVNDRAVAIITAVHSLGTASIGLIGPYMDTITEQEAAAITAQVSQCLQHDPKNYDSDVDVDDLSGMVQFVLDGVMDTDSARH